MTIRNKSLGDPRAVLSRPVVKLPDGKNALTWAELMHGCVIFGNAGSGKTSGVGAWMMHDILCTEAHPGLMALCVKQDERMRIERAVREAGREDDLVIISPENNYIVGALEYELFRNGRGAVEYNSALDLLMEIFTLGENYQAGGSSGGGSDDRYWDKSMRLRLIRLMMLLVLSHETVSIQNMRKLMVDSFSKENVEQYFNLWSEIESEDALTSEAAVKAYENWVRSNYFLHCFEAVNTRDDLDEEELNVLQLVGDYFLKESPFISPQTRSIIDSSIMGLFEPFNTGILRSHFSGEMSEEVKPERCYKEGAIIIVDISIKEYGISSIYAMGIFKKLFQLCQERRIIEQEVNPRPVVLWVDEFHLITNSTSDEKFQSTCRSTMTASVFITQSINNIKVAMGASLSEAKTKSLLTNLGTQIFCRNICRDTNVHASNLIGKAFIRTKSSSIDTNDRGARSSSEQLHFIIPPEHFLTLRTGSLVHKYLVDVIIVVGGKKWSSGERFLESTFDQRGRKARLGHHIFSFLKLLFYDQSK